MKSQGSIVLSRKFNIITVIIAFIVICTISITGCTNYSSDKYSPQIYENFTEVEKIFKTNKEAYMQMAYLLNESVLFDYLWSIYEEQPVVIYTQITKLNKILSKNEYEYLCTFMNEQRPYEFGQCEVGVYFVFLCENEDVTLYYTELETDSLSYFLHYIGQHSNVKELDDNWYCSVSKSDVTRE